jgi:hypothetical protein
VRGGAGAFYRHPFRGVFSRQGEQLPPILVIADEHSDGAHGLAVERGLLFARIHWIKIDAGVRLGKFCEMVAGINREQPDTPCRRGSGRGRLAGSREGILEQDGENRRPFAHGYLTPEASKNQGVATETAGCVEHPGSIPRFDAHRPRQRLLDSPFVTETITVFTPNKIDGEEDGRSFSRIPLLDELQAIGGDGENQTRLALPKARRSGQIQFLAQSQCFL